MGYSGNVTTSFLSGRRGNCRTGTRIQLEMGMQTVSGNLVRSRCSWETYERLLKDNQDSSSPRFTYDQGWLEIMSPSLNHEKINAALRSLVPAFRLKGELLRAIDLGDGH